MGAPFDLLIEPLEHAGAFHVLVMGERQPATPALCRTIRTPRMDGHLVDAGRLKTGSVAAALARPAAGREWLGHCYAAAICSYASTTSNWLFQAISKVADRIDRIITRVAAQFFSQLTDMTLNNVFLDVLIKNAINGIEYLRLANTPSAVLD